MKTFTDYLDEELNVKDSKGTLLNYLTSSFIKLANQETVDNRSMFLLLAATIMANNDDARAMGMSKRLAQLALSKKKDEKVVK